MKRTTRSTNLDLIRWLNHGHENTSKKLESITNANYLSKMATGDMEITDHTARSIETILGLPNGWLDRDNIAVLRMTSVDHSMHQVTASLPESAKRSLLSFIHDVHHPAS